MGNFRRLLNYVATALCVAVWISTPLGAQTPADRGQLDALFDQLRTADAQEVPRIQGQIIAEWSKSGSAAMDLLMRRGNDALDADSPEIAVEHFTALIDHAPDFVQGYSGRAAAYYRLGLLGPAIDDLRQVLVMEPRHFGAMTGIAVVLEDLGRVEDALEVWRRMEEFAPADGDVAIAIERLLMLQTGQSL